MSDENNWEIVLLEEEKYHIILDVKLEEKNFLVRAVDRYGNPYKRNQDFAGLVTILGERAHEWFYYDISGGDNLYFINRNRQSFLDYDSFIKTLGFEDVLQQEDVRKFFCELFEMDEIIKHVDEI